MERVAFTLFGGREPPSPEFPHEDYYATYQEMVEQFAPQHPFIGGNGQASNPVFAAYVVAWALRKSVQPDLVRRAVISKPSVMSGIFFDLYERQMQSEQKQSDKEPIMPLTDVGILYQALNSQVSPGQRVQLEISDGENGDGGPIDVTFEILEPINPNTGDAPQGRVGQAFRPMRRPPSNSTLRFPTSTSMRP